MRRNIGVVARASPAGTDATVRPAGPLGPKSARTPKRLGSLVRPSFTLHSSERRAGASVVFRRPSRESHENEAQCGTFSDNDRCDLLSSGLYRSERDCGPCPNDRDWNSGTFASGTGAIPAFTPSPNPSTSLTLPQGAENPVSPINPAPSPGQRPDRRPQSAQNQ